MALSTHFSQHQDQVENDLSDEESWVTHAHLDQLHHLCTGNFLFAFVSPLKIL